MCWAGLVVKHGCSQEIQKSRVTVLGALWRDNGWEDKLEGETIWLAHAYEMLPAIITESC